MAHGTTFLRRYYPILGLFLLACGGDATKPGYDAPEVVYQLARFLYTDEFGDVGPTTRGDFTVTAFPINDTLAAYIGVSDSGYIARADGAGPDGTDAWYPIVWPGTVSGFWRLFNDSLVFMGDGAGWLAAGIWASFPDSLVADWLLEGTSNPAYIRAMFRRRY